jgi:hypothetical protein
MPSVPLHGQRQRGKFGGERFAAKFCVICVTASLSFEFKHLSVTQIDSPGLLCVACAGNARCEGAIGTDRL